MFVIVAKLTRDLQGTDSNEAMVRDADAKDELQQLTLDHTRARSFTHERHAAKARRQIERNMLVDGGGDLGRMLVGFELLEI